jgi:hypothetical protein
MIHFAAPLEIDKWIIAVNHTIHSYQVE